MSDRVQFVCDGVPVDVLIEPGESLLSVLRERLGVIEVKDGCAPQGQCGCCTVLVDGAPRVACVTPATRIEGRAVTTVVGLEPARRDALTQSFIDCGGSQCGFCTPGILVRATAALDAGKTSKEALDRALGAHLCRCTGWTTVYDAITTPPHRRTRDLDAAAHRAQLEGGVPQMVSTDVPLGRGGFADDLAPRDALVAVPLPPGSDAESVEAAGLQWVIAETLDEARRHAGKVQGRRSTIDVCPPLALPPLPDGGVRLATSWVEPAYLEPDASWCPPAGEPASPLANGGAFGGKETSPVMRAARELADKLGRTARVVYSREDVVRLGPKRPPISASAVLRDGRIAIEGIVAGEAFGNVLSPYTLPVDASWRSTRAPGPPVGAHLRAVGLAEHTVLVEGALAEAGADREALLVDERAGHALLDTCAIAPSGALAGARVECERGAITRIAVRVAAGDPLDEIVLRSYATGAAHMALGWVCTEGLAVDSATGEIQSLTIRSFGVVRAKSTPRIDVTIVDDPGPPLARSSDAVFASVAAATWNALADAEGTRPESFPARETRAARRLRA